MAWWTIPAVTTGVQTIGNLLGGKSEAEKFYDRLKKEYETATGFSPEQKTALRRSGKTRLKRELGERAKSASASAGRREERLGPQFYTELEGTYGKAYGDYLPQIDLASEDYKQQKKARILEMLSGASGKMPSNTLDLSDLSRNLTMLQLLKNAGGGGQANQNIFSPELMAILGGDKSNLPPIDWSIY